MVTLHPGIKLLLSKTVLDIKEKEQQKESKEQEIQIPFNLFKCKIKVLYPGGHEGIKIRLKMRGNP